MRPLHDLLRADALSGRHLWAAGASVALAALARGTSLGGALPALHGRSVLLAMEHQLATALALIELDGVAGRLVLCPPGLSAEHRSHVMAGAGVDAVVSDGDTSRWAGGGGTLQVAGGSAVRPADGAVARDRQTEWVMLTSGTSGAPKMVLHSLASLTGAIERRAGAIKRRAGAIEPRGRRGGPIVWGTFYDIRRFGGLQILLRSVLCGGSLVLSDAAEIDGPLSRARRVARRDAHLRDALAMAQRARLCDGGRNLAALHPFVGRDRGPGDPGRSARALSAGRGGSRLCVDGSRVGFEVDDGLEGFPARLIGGGGEVDIKVLDGSLRVRSARAASCYVGAGAPPLEDADGFIDTGDLVEQRGERCYFIGRRGGIINVGGLKVHPEEVEAVINRHPDVQASLVRSRRNLIAGSIVIADAVLRAGATDRATEVKCEILAACREALANYKIPAAIRFVAVLDVAPTGKSVRHPVQQPDVGRAAS